MHSRSRAHRNHSNRSDGVHYPFRAKEADHDLAFAAVVSATCLAPAGWLPKSPSSATICNILVERFPYNIAI